MAARSRGGRRPFGVLSDAWTALVGLTARPEPPFEIRTPSRRWGRSARGPEWRLLRVTGVVRETPSTTTFLLEAADGRALGYLPGQHLTLLVEIDGVTHRRCYSFSCAPGAGPSITVKHVPGGRVSGHLMRNLKAGQILRAAEPSGSFTVRLEPGARRRYVMIAGGIGITPLLAMTEAILLGEPESRVVLLYGNRTEDEIAFRAQLETLAQEFPDTLTVIHALDTPPEAWLGARGPLGGEAVLELLGGGDRDASYLVCGPRPMMASVTAALAAAGVPSANVRLERFEYAARGLAPRPSSSFRVCFQRSGRDVRTTPGEPILDTALAAGVALDFSCRMGGCGACKLETAGGTVLMDEPNCLSQVERDAGFILACCAYPTSDLVVVGR